jgi:hypothetical protein
VPEHNSHGWRTQSTKRPKRLASELRTQYQRRSQPQSHPASWKRRLDMVRSRSCWTATEFHSFRGKCSKDPRTTCGPWWSGSTGGRLGLRTTSGLKKGRLLWRLSRDRQPERNLITSTRRQPRAIVLLAAFSFVSSESPSFRGRMEFQFVMANPLDVLVIAGFTVDLAPPLLTWLGANVASSKSEASSSTRPMQRRYVFFNEVFPPRTR